MCQVQNSIKLFCQFHAKNLDNLAKLNSDNEIKFKIFKFIYQYEIKYITIAIIYSPINMLLIQK